MKVIVGIAVAGAIGSLARYGLGGAMAKYNPWGTLAVNAIGCFLFGLVVALAEKRQLVSAEWRTILLAGFMGAFTTYSTFAFDALQLMKSSDWAVAAAYVAVHVVAGIGLVRAGMAVVT